MPHADPTLVANTHNETQVKLEDSDLEEGEIAPSPASLRVGDFESAVVVGANTLRSQLQLASCEYEALKQRYRTLAQRHDDIYELCSAYKDVIYGSRSYEEQAASIEQLRAEAGHQGMRAKALGADVLEPIIRKAGGLQALVSQMETIRPMIEMAGGLAELEDLVSNRDMCRMALEEVGGLQGLYSLIAEAQNLREQQRAYLESSVRCEGPDGLAAKAAKYDKLMQAFSDVQAPRDHAAPAGTATMNPARANLIASMPLQDDPYRDLYEPPPARQPCNKTGSNKIPLGPPRAHGLSAGRSSGQISLKREPLEDMQNMITKRPRADVEYTLAPAQRSMTPSFVGESVHEHHDQLPKNENGCFQPKTEETIPGYWYTEAETQRPDTIPTLTVTAKESSLSGYMMFSRFPIALWTGAASPSALEIPGQMKKTSDIPEELGRFLADELSKYMTKPHVQRFKAMRPNKEACILEFVLNRRKLPGKPQVLRACSGCTTSWDRHRRPCALLLDIERVRTVVFMPLPDKPDGHTHWTEKSYWVANTE